VGTNLRRALGAAVVAAVVAAAVLPLGSQAAGPDPRAPGAAASPHLAELVDDYRGLLRVLERTRDRAVPNVDPRNRRASI
jgi:hypothetical protein